MIRSCSVLVSLGLPLAIPSVVAMSTTAATTTRVIDSHLHVWASESEAPTFPYAEGQDPPTTLQNVASGAALVEQMEKSGVSGALIVQPINHKFDHSYVIDAMTKYPDRFKGMLLHDPSLPESEAVSQLEDLVLKGFVGVRFNPYLWPKTGEKSWTPMSSTDAGLAVYKRCGELQAPVGVMCFQGLQLHYDDIVALLKASPETTMILDHFGFTSFTDEGNAAFAQLLELVAYPQVIIKISALFRLNDSSPYDKVKTERLEPLLEKFGAERLMFGTDFPFVLEQPGAYGGTVDLVKSWLSKDEALCAQVMSGTSERVFGAWGLPN